MTKLCVHKKKKTILKEILLVFLTPKTSIGGVSVGLAIFVDSHCIIYCRSVQSMFIFSNLCAVALFVPWWKRNQGFILKCAIFSFTWCFYSTFNDLKLTSYSFYEILFGGKYLVTEWNQIKMKCLNCWVNVKVSERQQTISLI